MARKHQGPVVRLALSPTQAATALGVSYPFVIKAAIEEGRLGPVYLINGKRRIAVSDLERFLRSHPTVTTLATKRKSPC